MDIQNIDIAVKLRAQLDEANSQTMKVKQYKTKCVLIDKGDFNCDITIFNHDDETLVWLIEKTVIGYYEQKVNQIKLQIEAL